MLIAPHEQFCSISKALENIASGKMPDLQPDAISCYHGLIAVAERVQTDQEELERLHLELTREVSASRLLMEREHLYREVFAKSVIAIVIATEDGSILDANNAAEGMLGYRIEELKHFHVADIALPDDHGSDDALIRDLLDGRRLYYNIEKRYVRNDGILLWVMLTTFAVYGGTGTPNLVHMFEDISARKSAEQYLQHVSTHDALTGLHNRAFFDVEFNRLQFSLALPVSIVMIDVDGLKKLNDTKGHEAGDYLIIGVAVILKEAFRGDDIVARIGGDEFAAILFETGETEAEKVIERIRKCQTRFNNSTPRYQVHFSIGVATAMRGMDIQATFKEADARMYADKVQRKAALQQAAETGLESSLPSGSTR